MRQCCNVGGRGEDRTRPCLEAATGDVVMSSEHEQPVAWIYVVSASPVIVRKQQRDEFTQQAKCIAGKR